MLAVYGDKFATLWQEVDQREMKAVWTAALSRLTRNEIESGMRRLIECGKPFPPTLPEFFALCRPPIAIPPADDQRGLDDLARRYGISTIGCDSYHALRVRLVNHLRANNDTTLRLADLGVSP